MDLPREAGTSDKDCSIGRRPSSLQAAAYAWTFHISQIAVILTFLHQCVVHPVFDDWRYKKRHSGNKPLE